MTTDYCTGDEVRKALSPDRTTVGAVHDEDIARAVTEASRWIDQHCDVLGRRCFHVGESASTRKLSASCARWDDRMGCWLLDVPDLASITTVELDIGDANTFTTYSTSYYYTLPLSGVAYGITTAPTEQLVFPDLSLRQLGRYPLARLTGVFGWASRPPAVTETAIQLAKFIVQSRDTRGGFLMFGDAGIARAKADGLFSALHPYVRGGQGLPGFA